MCILLCTTSHPDYAFILGSNRDEFFCRPTKGASFINDDILMPIDMAREEHGTWIGVTKSGRICVLVNYRENIYPCQMGVISRGLISRDFLESNLDPLLWADNIKKRTNNFANIGGFSLLFGELKPCNKNNLSLSLYVISNRSDNVINPFQESKLNSSMKTAKILGLSNSSIFNPWPKVTKGEELMHDLIDDNVKRDKNEIIDKMFEIMKDQYIGFNRTTTTTTNNNNNKNSLLMSESLRNLVPQSIFVPRLTNDLNLDIKKFQGNYYGTRTQTVIVMTHSGELTYIERNIADEDDDKSFIPVSTGMEEHRFDFIIT